MHAHGSKPMPYLHAGYNLHNSRVKPPVTGVATKETRSELLGIIMRAFALKHPKRPNNKRWASTDDALIVSMPMPNTLLFAEVPMLSAHDMSSVV